MIALARNKIRVLAAGNIVLGLWKPYQRQTMKGATKTQVTNYTHKLGLAMPSSGITYRILIY